MISQLPRAVEDHFGSLDSFPPRLLPSLLTIPPHLCAMFSLSQQLSQEEQLHLRSNIILNLTPSSARGRLPRHNQRHGYQGYNDPDHPINWSVTHTHTYLSTQPTRSPTHTHSTTGRWKWVEESIQSQCSSISRVLLRGRKPCCHLAFMFPVTDVHTDTSRANGSIPFLDKPGSPNIPQNKTGAPPST